MHLLLRPLLPIALTLLACAARAAEPTDLRFDEIVRQPIGARGIEFSDKLLAAQGQSVRISGYMVHQEAAEPGRFLLAPRPIMLSEHADGLASDLPINTITVMLDPSQAQRVVVPINGPVTLSGLLQVGRNEAADGSVSWLRLQLAPDALQQP